MEWTSAHVDGRHVVATHWLPRSSDPRSSVPRTAVSMRRLSRHALPSTAPVSKVQPLPSEELDGVDALDLMPATHRGDLRVRARTRLLGGHDSQAVTLSEGNHRRICRASALPRCLHCQHAVIVLDVGRDRHAPGCAATADGGQPRRRTPGGWRRSGAWSHRRGIRSRGCGSGSRRRRPQRKRRSGRRRPWRRWPTSGRRGSPDGYCEGLRVCGCLPRSVHERSRTSTSKCSAALRMFANASSRSVVADVVAPDRSGRARCATCDGVRERLLALFRGTRTPRPGGGCGRRRRELAVATLGWFPRRLHVVGLPRR